MFLPDNHATERAVAAHLSQESSHNHNRPRNDFVLLFDNKNTPGMHRHIGARQHSRRYCFRCWARRLASRSRLAVLTG